MKKLSLSILLIIACSAQIRAQFHTMKIPQASNHVTETQTLGVTDITIDYHSPAVRERDVWNNTDIIPQNANPVAWRAGANMNTTISFSTDVMIEGQFLPAGKYGFHIVPRGDTYELNFAHNNHQWGSYYLDLEKDVTLKVEVSAVEETPFSEKLDYEFLNWTPEEVTVALEWANRRIPFKVSVDLNKTVVESFRSELRGINTYHWQAWNDAARWCLVHNTNLEEALEWANRSVNGGYNGFAANKNAENLRTKAELEQRLGKTAELEQTLSDAIAFIESPYDANFFSIYLLGVKKTDLAMELLDKSIAANPESWFLMLNQAVGYYFQGKEKRALSTMEKVKSMAPANFQDRLTTIEASFKDGTYTIPGF
ncbi:DUF2911 domain-containing protein [Roseivirga sp.]|uniref:DUF2911 domain-containing protein n=1 Tax=Roseivirga sp. TaxID=1964215 RepID=UPI003B5195DF